MPSERPKAGVHVFLFAHQDDEFAVFGHLERLAAEANQVWCIYLTDGSARGASPVRRNAESLQVLASLGLPQEQIHFLGSRAGLRDGALHEDLGGALAALAEILSTLRIAALYIPAWEGGHHDHDCTHAVGKRVGLLLGVTTIFQYPLYDGATTWGPWFSVMRPLATNGPIHHFPFTFASAFRYLRWCLTYRSQWRTWVGLLPFYAVRILVNRSMPLQPCVAAGGVDRPHPGPLYYERRFQVPYRTVAMAIASLDALSPRRNPT